MTTESDHKLIQEICRRFHRQLCSTPQEWVQVFEKAHFTPAKFLNPDGTLKGLRSRSTILAIIFHRFDRATFEADGLRYQLICMDGWKKKSNHMPRSWYFQPVWSDLK